ncbi:UbiX family flavin prenyltransferase [Actinospica sp.]|jgi:4-hydroxy-3-polyprenylbenzoate decarboxylase|uniref:UbiX family flavin prenyltransferase n=1 Tax=Actinospica sp. TaxID=1872142 RepID=UPI002CD83BC0|nr:UbiX family flavin prenyltransferase [Actinospica sp.]HWG23216.1 UbiX family flavin prenyltransferase [Actinospica sp.]
MSSEQRRPWVVGISGASGTPYAVAAIGALLDGGEDVDLVVSRAARLTILDETGISFRDSHWRDDLAALLGWKESDSRLDAVRYWTAGDFAAGPSSGSYPVRGMLVVPATAAAVAGISIGLSKDLLQRAASVNLKERRPLVLVVRETPLSSSTLEQLLTLSREGAVILPASPGFYAGGQSVQRLVDFVAGKALDALGVSHALLRRWDGRLGERRE